MICAECKKVREGRKCQSPLTLLRSEKLVQIELRVARIPARSATVRGQDMPVLELDVHRGFVEAHGGSCDVRAARSRRKTCPGLV